MARTKCVCDLQQQKPIATASWSWSTRTAQGQLVSRPLSTDKRCCSCCKIMQRSSLAGRMQKQLLAMRRCNATGLQQQRHRLRAMHGPCTATRRPTARAAAAGEDVLLRSMSDLGEVSVLVVDGTKLVQEAASRHKTAPTATAALGRALLGTLLMGSFRKEDEMLQVTFRGDGPLGSMMTIADTRGNVRGKVSNPSADPPLRDDNKLNVGAAVGQGVLAVVRSHPLQPQPYTGMVPIISGEVAEDLANYLVDSEQTNSALGLGVAVNRDCSVKAAGGFLIQVLPFCSEETLAQLEQNLSGLPSVSQMLTTGLTPEDITNKILNGLGVAPNAQTVQPKYGPCDTHELRERYMRAVASLGEKEVKSIIAEQGKVEVTCDFCNSKYQFTEAELMPLIQQQSSITA